MSEDPFAGYRSLLTQSKLHAVDGLEFSHAAPLRQQLANPDAEADLPALCCLLAAEVMGGSTDAAMPAATALALLGEMERVFTSIASEDEDGLESKWGMPRTLNAGDAFFNLAQAVLLRGSAGIDEPRQLLLMSYFDKASRAYAESLHDRSVEAKRNVIGVAMALGVLAVGAEETRADQFAGFALDSERLASAGLSPEVQEKLRAAALYLAEVGSW